MCRAKERLRRGYKFFKLSIFDTEKDFSSPELDEGYWESVSVPHDWAIGKDFAPENDMTRKKILADGIFTEIPHTGRTGALPTVGIGWYRLPLDIPRESAGKKIELIFDGVMWECEVYLNGKPVGKNHFGYRSFCIDITDSVNYGEKNILAVKAIVYKGCSRWYSGAGIYRNVYLVTKDKCSVDYCGLRTQIYTNEDLKSARLEINLDASGEPDGFEYELISPSGESVLCADAVGKSAECTVASPELWDISSPKLYTLVVRVKKNGKLTDTDSTKIGFRHCLFTADKGFFLNGKHVKLNGICMHHDLGVFGAAVNNSALRRQCEIMKGMGANSIRTSHNPPTPELLEICDELGILVLEEFFDEWRLTKLDNGYAKYFDGHAEDDVTSVIRRDMNHPSVIMWSIGNEILEQHEEHPEGDTGLKNAEIAHFLTDICHREDKTRPTTAGYQRDIDAESRGFFDAVDIIGINYKPHRYRMWHEKYPDKIFYGSETISSVSTRGEYKLPAIVQVPCPENDDLTESDYGLTATNWASYPDREFVEQTDCEFLLGEYVWTGFDYLGEPTPYYTRWPARSSYFGIVDTSGLPKGRYYLYKSVWGKEKCINIIPHWNFEGHEGELIPVHVLTNYDRVELFLNGKSYGIREKSKEVRVIEEKAVTDLSDVKRFRIIFDNVPYEAGELVALAIDGDGNEIDRVAVKTAGEPYAIRLEAERKEILSDGEDCCYVRACVVDRNGTVCPRAMNVISFTAEGAGRVYATDNGDQRDTNGYTRSERYALNGACAAVLVANEGESGKITLTARSAGLISDKTKINVK